MNITLADRFKTAGKELLKLNVGNVVKSFTAPGNEFIVDPANYYRDGGFAPFNNALWMFNADGQGHDRYFTYTDANCSLQAVEYPINNIIGAYESRNTLIRKRGPQYVISNNSKDSIGTKPMTPDEKTEIERNFSYRYGLTKGQMQAIITSASINVQTIGYDVAQLKLHEEVQESSIAVCNGLSYPPFLLGLSDSTYNNQAEASRGLYMETLIPEANSISDQLNAIFETEQDGITISKDFSHVSALQEDKLNAATAREMQDKALEREFKNNVITLDMWRTGLDLDAIGDKYGVMYYYQLIMEGWTFGNTTAAGGDTKPVGDSTTTQTGSNGTGN
jgi:hypothetical protein